MFGRFQRKKKAGEDDGAAPANKYGNKKVVFDGIKFDSKREKDRYLFLKEAESRGEIADLRLQVLFHLVPAQYDWECKVSQLKTKVKKELKRKVKHMAITYRCDFMYTKTETHEVVVEDVKSSPNMAALDKAFLLKEKLMSWIKHIDIKRVYKAQDPI